MYVSSKKHFLFKNIRFNYLVFAASLAEAADKVRALIGNFQYSNLVVTREATADEITNHKGELVHA